MRIGPITVYIHCDRCGSEFTVTGDRIVVDDYLARWRAEHDVACPEQPAALSEVKES